jgi:putative membrane-bound dehydrogenase-like protein
MFRSVLLVTSLIFTCPRPLPAADGLQFGFGKTDITPQTPLRLSGYANRAEPFAGVDESLLVRAMAMQSGEDPVCVLVSVDTIGFPGTLTRSILERLTAEHGIMRERFVVCCTHSHTAPEVGALSEMFDVPFTDEQKQQTAKYRQRLSDQVVAAVAAAIEDLKPGRMFAGEGEATFAVNRRVLTDGVWSGFGINPRGPVDHRLPFLKVTGADGKSVRGILFNYACHCTTFGGDYNRVNGDWAGYAAKYLEEAHSGLTALCTIGTGADANPERDRERAFELAKAQGQEIADEINGLLDADLTEVTGRPTASFGYAGLPIDRPTKQQLEESLKSPRRPVRVHAETMLATLERMGRLPETYPMPIQVWRFGDQFAMVFLGGEVCVDYGLRIKKELASGRRQPADSPRTAQPASRTATLTPWVVAYANDVFGYVASERMRPEGGYEVDFSMIYYMLPGPWSSGTEEVILRRVHEMYASTGKVGPLSPEDALGTFTIPEGYQLEIVAAEPLIKDPVNMALDRDGRLWVVEMGDYPRGGPEVEKGRQHGDHPFEGPPGGAIKRLIDTDGDGRYDESVTFLDKLSFPTGVQPWKDGILISVAPDILFARDTDGDGKADEQQVLYTGFKLANPQHRVNGFVPDVDGWFQLASGDNNKTITSTKTGETLDMSGRDLRIHPESGRMEALTGRSQWCRTVDAQGNWFGNDNSDPLYHFVIEDRYLKRNPFVAAPDPKVHLTTPHRAPPVYPTSRTLDRFNDLFALNRFTSACSPYVWKSVSTPDQTQVLVCEPVHNLVSRIILEPDGVTFRGRRHEDEQQSEFLDSTDNWFRPVRVIEGADGSLLICDMYRMVIEHPQWIPEAWQDQLDLYAGHDMGRIWRLAAATREADGSSSDDVADPFLRQGRLQRISPASMRHILANAEAAIEDPLALPGLLATAQDPDIRIRYSLALLLGESKDPRIADTLLFIARSHPDDIWIRTAVLSSAVPHALPMLESLLADRDAVHQHRELLEGLIATALGEDVERTAPQVAALIAGGRPEAEVQLWQMSALSSFLDALRRRGASWEKIVGSVTGRTLSAQMQPIFAAARETASDLQAPVDTRAAALVLLGNEPGRANEDVAFLASLLAPQSPVELQTAAVEVLARRAADQVPRLLLANWKQHSPALRQTILGTLLSRDNWMRALADALEAGDVPPADMDAATRQRLLTTWNGPVREAAARLYGADAQSDRAEVIAAYDGVRDLTGEPGRGAEVFKKTCSACHQHGGIGKDLAPQLANLTNKSTDALLTAILDPNRAVEQKYTGYVVVTADGRALSGLIKSETGGSLTLAEPNGTEHVILRIDIEQMQATGKSFMPEGLEKDLSQQDLADVISFVQQARSPSPK